MRIKGKEYLIAIWNLTLNTINIGLGLSIVKELIDLIESKIRFESIENIGSSFSFYIVYDNIACNSSSSFEEYDESLASESTVRQDLKFLPMLSL
jgi:hypothetical protein